MQRSRAGASDSEDELMNYVTPAQKRAAPTKSTKENKMPRQTAAGKKTATKRKAAPKQDSRQALKDQTNLQGGDEDPNEDENDGGDTMEIEEENPKAKRAKANGTSKKQTGSGATGRTSKAKATKRAQPAEELGAIPETQPEPEDISQSIEIAVESTPQSKKPSNDRQPATLAPTLQPRPSARAGSMQPLQPRPSARAEPAQPSYSRAGSAQPVHPRPRERSGSVSGTERERRGGDPDLRRKLNDMTQKYENLHLKYQNLQEIGHDTAESNFEKLKRASDQTAKGANDLIASLKKEIADLKKTTASKAKDESELINLRKQIATLTAANTKLTTDSAQAKADPEPAHLRKQLASLTATNTKLTTETTELKSTLQASQNETKVLETKLIAARQQLSNSGADASKPPSEAKSLTRSVGPATNATEAAKEAKMKENLYADLTGLIIRGVKRKDDEDVYDCIQTGRNGTLHFHLLTPAAPTLPNNGKSAAPVAEEDFAFEYEPLLNEDRDRALLAVLDDFLVEPLVCPRHAAVKFYMRLFDCMMRKIEVDEEEGEEMEGEDEGEGA